MVKQPVEPINSHCSSEGSAGPC